MLMSMEYTQVNPYTIGARTPHTGTRTVQPSRTRTNVMQNARTKSVRHVYATRTAKCIYAL